MAWIGVLGFLIAALAYGATTVLLLVSHPGGRRASWLVAAAAGSTFWALGYALSLSAPLVPLPLLFALDAMHLFLWTACALSYLAPAGQSTGRAPLRRALLPLSALVGAWVVLAPLVFGPGSLVSTAYTGLVGMAAVGLLAVEQLLRNAREDHRRAFEYFCIAIGGVFVADLLVYSQAIVVSGLIPVLWENRGFANALLVPLLVVAVKRQTEWERDLFVSRQVAFYTASLLGVGGYLVLMGLAAYFIRAVGGEWGAFLQLLFLLAALVLLAIVLFSAKIRARVKVFLIKHFYRNKYDYREEWLRLTEILGRTGEARRLAEHALAGIARIIESSRGELWLNRDGSRYECMAVLGAEEAVAAAYSKDDTIVRFLATKGWVIDSEEYAQHPDLYGSYFGPPADHTLPPGSVIVPLDCQGRLLGFAVLYKTAAGSALNFEDHDILKTAGRQVAVVLAQALAQEQLAATRQFEAMNRLSAFLMHDLKNVIAQQELVVANAQRFRDRPGFFDDAITTIKSGADRMRKVLEQLRSSNPPDAVTSRVDVTKALMEVRSHCADREPVPEIDAPERPVWARMERDQLMSVLTHLLRNAQDATPPSGRISLSVSVKTEELEIQVVDTGCGMDKAFLRDRLFRPFDSTKGTRGMGIGAYQVRELVRAAGGDVEVVSAPGVGTSFLVRIPLAASATTWQSGVPAA